MANLSGEGGRFNNLMEKQSQTFAGMMSNLSDSWTNFLRNAGAPLLEVGKKILVWLLDLVNNGLPKAMEYMKNFGQIMQDNMPIFYGVGAAIMTALVPAIIAAAVAMAPFILMALELAAIAAVVGGAVYLLAEAWKNNLGGIQEKTKAVWDYLTTAFNYVQTNWLPVFRKGLGDIWDIVKQTMSAMVDAFKSAFDFLKPYILATFSIIKSFWDNHFKDILSILSGAWTIINGLFSG